MDSRADWGATGVQHAPQPFKEDTMTLKRQQSMVPRSREKGAQLRIRLGEGYDVVAGALILAGRVGPQVPAFRRAVLRGSVGQ